MNRGQARLFPIERVRQELDYILSEGNVRHLYITDSEINVDDQHAKESTASHQSSKEEAWLAWCGNLPLGIEPRD